MNQRLGHIYLNLYERLKAGQAEEGQGMAEYGLILVLVAVALIGAFIALSGGISTVLERINCILSGGGSKC
jgi:pilus assembly protein Flp/PilA